MSLKVTYDEKAIRRAKERLTEMRERAEDCSPAFDVFIGWFADRNFQQFLSRGGEYGTPWKPLAERTLREKARLGFPLDPLIRTARLVHSISLRPLAVEHIGPREATAGTNVRYAGFHQKGTRHMPARPLFSAREIQATKAATFALANWIIAGERSVRPRKLRGR